MIKFSYIYDGKVIHKRFKPKEHFFTYKVFSLFIDLSELYHLEKELKLFSYNKFNLLSFYDKDHGPRDGTSLITWVKKNLVKNGINNVEEINIKLLCYPRVWGYVFNPLSIFFIYDKFSNLISILYEVKNTFGEQHTYVFKIDNKKQMLEHSCRKKFYVSPFIEMNCQYDFKILKPGDKLSVLINQSDESGKLLFASQDGIKRELSNKNLIFSYISHPLMSFKIIGAIHFEALKLWLKGVKIVKKKLKIKNDITFEN
tara:strand:+ start:1291 stop:2061 length:771 start_codon:yes stop_codon:yes gene_type:complete